MQDRVLRLLRSGYNAKETAIICGVTQKKVLTYNERYFHVPLKLGQRKETTCCECGSTYCFRGRRCRDCFNKRYRVKIDRRFGELNPLWNGGSWKNSGDIRADGRYAKWRKEVFERDRHSCVKCGVRGGKLHADHILPKCIFPEDTFDVNNGRTLCEKCHRATFTWGKTSRQLLQVFQWFIDKESNVGHDRIAVRETSQAATV